MCHINNGDFSDLLLLNHTAPGPPQDLKGVSRTCHSITFQWSPPDDTGRLDITGYDILHNGTPLANITGTVYTLEGLTPDTMHTISVRTRNAIGPSVLEGTLTAVTGGRGTHFSCTFVITVLCAHVTCTTLVHRKVYFSLSPYKINSCTPYCRCLHPRGTTKRYLLLLY